MNIRVLASSDEAAVTALLGKAFPTDAEAALVRRLRADGDLAFELVAEQDQTLLGYIAFPGLKAPGRALGLAPVAVEPARQGQGIGGKLIEAGHDRARSEGWRIIFVLGDPNYYRRFGYSLEAAAPYGGPYAGEYFMARALGEALPPPEEVLYPPAFAALS